MILLDGLQVAIVLNHYVLWNGLDVTNLSLHPDLIPVLLAGANDWLDSELPGSGDPGLFLLDVVVNGYVFLGDLSMYALIDLLKDGETLRLLEVDGELEMYRTLLTSLQLTYTVVSSTCNVDAVEYSIWVLTLFWVVEGT